MKQVRRLSGGIAAACVVLSLGGCAISPFQSGADIKSASNAERDLLTDAVTAVETAPWPKPQSASLFSRITGGVDSVRVTRSDAVETYIGDLRPAGQRFAQLALDARSNLGAAERLNQAAQMALLSPRRSKNDVAVIESAIQTLREHRQIYSAAAKSLEKDGEQIDGVQMNMIREAYHHAIKRLGETADAFVDQIEADRTETFASPNGVAASHFSGT